MTIQWRITDSPLTGLICRKGDIWVNYPLFPDSCVNQLLYALRLFLVFLHFLNTICYEIIETRPGSNLADFIVSTWWMVISTQPVVTPALFTVLLVAHYTSIPLNLCEVGVKAKSLTTHYVSRCVMTNSLVFVTLQPKELLVSLMLTFVL